MQSILSFRLFRSQLQNTYWALYTDHFFFFFFFHWTTYKTHIVQGVSSIGLIKSPIPHFRSPQFGVACGSCCRPAIKRLRQIHVIYVLAQAESSLAGWNCESLGFGGAPWCYGNRLTRWFVTVEIGNTICWALNVDHFVFLDFCCGLYCMMKSWALFTVHIFVLGFCSRRVYWVLYVDHLFSFFILGLHIQTILRMFIRFLGDICNPLPYFCYIGAF